MLARSFHVRKNTVRVPNARSVRNVPYVPYVRSNLAINQLINNRCPNHPWNLSCTYSEAFNVLSSLWSLIRGSGDGILLAPPPHHRRLCAYYKLAEVRIRHSICADFFVFSRPYCYTVWWAIGITMSPVCPSVRIPVYNLHCVS